MAINGATTKPIVQHSKRRIRQRLFRSEANDTLPITIRHERIYILPTGRGMAFLGVLLIMLLASMNYRLNLGYALSFILIGLFASSLLSTYLNLVKLTFTSVSAKDTFAGTPLVFEVKIKESGNRSRHSIEIATADSRDRIDIKRGHSSTALLSIASPARGVRNIGRITLSSDFPLGLWRGWGYIHAESIGYVYPAPEIPVVPFQSARREGLEGSEFSDEREFKELRAYQITDNPSAIAWKTVARGGQWYTKEFEATTSANCDVEIRWEEIDRTLSSEQRLSRMCAWLVEAEKKSLPYDIQLPGYNHQSKQRGPGAQKKHLRQLALFNRDSY